MKDQAVRLSRILHWIFLLGMWAVPVLTLAYFWNLEWMLAHEDEIGMLPAGVGLVLPLLGPVTYLTKLLCLAVAAVPAALTCALLRHLALLFGNYSRGEVFTAGSVRHVRRVGILVLIRVGITPVVGAAMAVALTINNPPGHHIFTLGLSSSDLTQVVTGMALIVAAAVMDQGRRLYDEALLTI